MPLKLNPLRGSIKDRIDKLRRTIKDGEGLTLTEIADAAHCGASQIHNVLCVNKWAIKTFDSISSRNLTVLVNPKTLKEYNAKKD